MMRSRFVHLECCVWAVAAVCTFACGAENPRCGSADPPELVLLDASDGPLANGDSIDVEHGFQGGIHSFLTLEIRGFHPGLDISLRATEGGRSIGSRTDVFDLTCETDMQRVDELQLIWSLDPMDFDGLPITLEVTVSDAQGLSQTLTRDLVLHEIPLT